MFQFQEKRTPLWAVPLPVLALIFPIILIPFEKVFSHGCLIEEAAKLVLVLFVSLQISERSFQWKMVFTLGCVFALSESALYLPSFGGDSIISLFLKRVLLTTSLHVFTMMILLFFVRQGRWFIAPGFALAVASHFLYNELVVYFFN